MDSSFIKHIKQFIELTEAETLLLTSHLKPVKLKKKTFLFEEGQVCKANYFVEKGCLRLFFVNKKGNEQITQFAIENWWIADYMSLDRQKPSLYYLQAVEASEIISLDIALQEKLFKKIPQLETYFRMVQLKAYAALQFRVRTLKELSKEDGYHYFKNLFPEFLQRIPQYMLASYLGFTPEYLSELRNKR